jgi:hypothetical protein
LLKKKKKKNYGRKMGERKIGVGGGGGGEINEERDNAINERVKK